MEKYIIFSLLFYFIVLLIDLKYELIKPTFTYIRNYWQYQSILEISIIIISVVLIIISFLFSKYGVLTMLLGFSINYIVSNFHSFEKDRNILTERRGYLTYMMNIYNNPTIFCIKTILSKIKNKDNNIFGSHKATISNTDASELKEYLLSLKEDAYYLINNKSITWKEKNTLHTLIGRINNFIGNNPNIEICKDGVIYGVTDIEINSKWLGDIPYLFEREKNNIHHCFKTTIEEMYNKYSFEELPK